jgi:AraC-like DNA-binding protein
MPWGPELDADVEFEARIESRQFDQGAAARAVMTPVAAFRTKRHVSHSPVDGIYANYSLSGELVVEQNGDTKVARRGDIVVYRTMDPVALLQRSDRYYKDIPMLFDVQDPPFNAASGDRLRNVVLTRQKMLAPLSASLAYLAENIATDSNEVLNAVFGACAALLPMAARCSDRMEPDEASPLAASYLLREIMEYIAQNISDAHLSPRSAAEHFGISARYVHKLFATGNMTFNAFVAGKRLEHVRSDLLSLTCRRQPVSGLAYRWGFNDLSSFNRRFKQRFGCSPSQYRARATR